MDHKQYLIKTAHGQCWIDREMRSIIKLMNNLPRVETLFSCQGHFRHSNPEGRKPYVLFICEDQGSLFKIVNSLTQIEGNDFLRLGLITIDVNFGFFRYSIRFNDRACLKYFTKKLREIYKLKVEVSNENHS